MKNRPSGSEFEAGAENSDSASIPVSEIDHSCRWPVMFLVICSLAWLVGGGILALIGSIKLHAPGFLASQSWLTYGRVYPAAVNSLVYGFAVQAAIAVGLWLMARLGRSVLMGGKGILLGTFFWNVAVKLGVWGILAGASTGHPLLEMPGYVSPLLLASYSLMGAWALVTFHFRRARRLYVSQWYLVGALFWFPWMFIVAQSLLVFNPVRGALQAVVSGWYGHVILALWLVPVGLAALFYFIPKLVGRPLHSRYLAMFGFWTLAVFAGWGGVHAGAPVPRWMSSVCIVAGMMMLLPLIAVAMNWCLTIRSARAPLDNNVFRFVRFGAIAYFAASLLDIGGSFRAVGEVTDLTVFPMGVRSLYLYGFFGMTVAGAVYYLVPKITQTEWPSERLIRFHYRASVIGISVLVIAQLAGGMVQGVRVNNASVPFLDAIHSTMPFLGVSTLGALGVLVANAALFVNAVRLAATCCRSCCFQTKQSSAEPKPAVAGADL